MIVPRDRLTRGRRFEVGAGTIMWSRTQWLGRRSAGVPVVAKCWQRRVLRSAFLIVLVVVER